MYYVVLFVLYSTKKCAIFREIQYIVHFDPTYVPNRWVYALDYPRCTTHSKCTSFHSQAIFFFLVTDQLGSFQDQLCCIGLILVTFRPSKTLYFTWYLLGIYLVFTWFFLGIYFGITWILLGIYLVFTWYTLGIFFIDLVFYLVFHLEF